MTVTRPKTNQDRPKDAKCVFRGVLFDVYQWQQEMYDGSFETFEQLIRRDSVNIIAVTSEGKILITDQEQPGSKPFVGLPGGVIDDGEDVDLAAKRELLEETGHKAKSFELWDSSQPSGKIDWVIYTIIARGCKKNSKLNLDAGEKISVREVDFDEFIKIVLDKDFRDKELSMKVMRAKIDDRIEEFRKLILGST